MALDLRRARPARPNAWWLSIGVMAGLLLLLSVLVYAEWEPISDLDSTVADNAYAFSEGHATWIRFLDLVQHVSEPWVLRVVLLVIAIVMIIRRESRLVLWLLMVIVAENILAPLAKLVVDRPRPEWTEPLITIGGYSYPSGHAAGAGMFAAAMILLTVVLTARGPIRHLLNVGWVMIALAIMANRLLLGVHYVSDVVGGALLGSIIVLVIWVLVMGGVSDDSAKLVTTTGTGSKRVGVVFNPIKVGDNTLFQEQVRAAAALAGWRTPTFYATKIDDPGTSMAHAAIEAGVDMVLVAGGDGTVRIVCTELARTGVAVGIVPLGTGNLLARNLGIPLHRGDAINVALEGQDRAIDIVRLTTEVEGEKETSFMVMAGLGLDAAIMTGAPDELKARMGWLAYVVSALKQIRYPAVRVSISVDDRPPVRYRARTVLVGNVGQLQAGIPLLPDALIDDGVIDVVVIAPKRTLSWLWVVVRVLARHRRTDEGLDRMTGRKVVIRAERPTPRQLDGDPIGEGSELIAEIQPGTLLVRVPN